MHYYKYHYEDEANDSTKEEMVPIFGETNDIPGFQTFWPLKYFLLIQVIWVFQIPFNGFPICSLIIYLEEPSISGVKKGRKNAKLSNLFRDWDKMVKIWLSLQGTA